MAAQLVGLFLLAIGVIGLWPQIGGLLGNLVPMIRRVIDLVQGKTPAAGAATQPPAPQGMMAMPVDQVVLDFAAFVQVRDRCISEGNAPAATALELLLPEIFKKTSPATPAQVKP